jgi:ribosomal protein S12 methylthiotransferase accessory factor
MLTRPTFKPHFHVEVVPDEGVFLLSGSRQSLLKGPLYEHVAACLDGRSANAVCEALAGQHSPAEVYYTIMQLEKKGYLCEQEEALPAEEAALWSSQQVDPGAAAQRLAEAPVAVRGLGVDAAPLRSLLQALHVRVQEAGALEVVLTDSYLRKELQEINAAALGAGRPWLLCRPLGREVWLGPLFRPGKTGCWECLAQRLRSNRPVESYLQDRDGRPGPLLVDRARTAATLQTAWGLIANAVAAWVVQGSLPALEGKVQAFDLGSWQLQAHSLVRLPYCPVCGSPGEERTRPFQPVSLQGQKKTFTADGGHRVVSPETTLERYRHHVSSITGAVSMLERSSPATAEAMHVYMAGTNFARRHHSLAQLRSDLRNMSSGKGATDLQAKASGLCEGLERYSGVFRGDEPRLRARFSDLGDRAIHPHDCLHFSERQYRERDAWNERQSHFNFVPMPLEPDAEIDWSPVWSLTRRQERYLPTAFCYFDCPHPPGKLFCVSDSNGNAAGNTLEEAILQGFLELVERDSVALWWYNRVRRPAVDVDSFGEPYLHELQEYLRQQGRDLWVLDLTSDLDIPVFVSLSRRPAGSPEQIVLGFGAHLEARVALLRSVTEMNQMLSQVLMPADRGQREEVTDLETLHWLKTATVANQPYLLPAEGEPARGASSFPRTWTDDMADDVRACQALVERQGLEMLVLDQTRPEVGLPVAKVIVPGLRHFWARFAPGRLYDVPVQLGWLPQAVAEEDLNPMAMFL